MPLKSVATQWSLCLFYLQNCCCSYTMVRTSGHSHPHIPSSWAKHASRPHDAPLSVKGLAQAHRLARWLKKKEGIKRVDHIITSPMIRCVQTADILAQQYRAAIGSVVVEKGQSTQRPHSCLWLSSRSLRSLHVGVVMQVIIDSHRMCSDSVKHIKVCARERS